MKRIEVHLKQTSWHKVLQYFVLATVTFLLLYFAKGVNLEQNSMNLAEGVVAILVIVLYAVVANKADIIFNKKRELIIDETGLGVLNGKKEHLKLKWSEISKLFLIFKGVRFFLVVVDNRGKEVEMELTALWFLSAFNSSKGLRYNHQKLMLYFGDLANFREKLDLQHYKELLEEYKIPAPQWFIKRVESEIIT